MDKRKKRRIGNLKKRWRRSYKEGKSEVNPDAVDFMTLKGIPEILLYSHPHRQNLKYLLVIDSDGIYLKGPFLSTKFYNKRFKLYNLKICNRKKISNEYNPQYVEIVPRKVNKNGEMILNKDCVITLKNKISYSEMIKIKKALDKRIKEYNKEIKRINYYKNKKEKHNK